MSVDPKVIRGVIAKAKLVLTNHQFKYFQLHYEFEMDAEQIATLEGKSVSSIYTVLARAKKRMRDDWK